MTTAAPRILTAKWRIDTVTLNCPYCWQPWYSARSDMVIRGDLVSGERLVCVKSDCGREFKAPRIEGITT